MKNAWKKNAIKDIKNGIRTNFALP